MLLNATNLLWVAIAMNSCWFFHKHLILWSEMLLWCKPSAVKSANALWLDVGRFRSNSAGDPTNLQHATTSDDHHNSFEIDSQQFWVQQSLSKVSRTSSDFHQFYNNFHGEMFLNKGFCQTVTILHNPNLCSLIHWFQNYFVYAVRPLLPMLVLLFSRLSFTL